MDLPRAGPNSGAVATTTAILALLTNAQIARETSNEIFAASGHTLLKKWSDGDETALEQLRLLDAK
jgi:hypothetical protein